MPRKKSDRTTKSGAIEAKLAELARLREDAPDPKQAREILIAALKDKSNFVAAHAADATAALGLRELAPELEEAFARFELDPVERDKTCAAKTAIARALDQLDVRAVELFARGIRLRQIEPAWGGPTDTAATLRAICAAGLARSYHPDVLFELVELFADKETIARMGAAQALGCTGQQAALPVLRLYALRGDPEPQVISECFVSLLALHAESSEPFVARFLAAEDEAVAEVAALALGQSRRESAFEVLKGAWEKRINPRLSGVLLLAMAILRIPKATEFLLHLIRETGDRGAIKALEVFKDDPAAAARVEEAIAAARKKGLL